MTRRAAAGFAAGVIALAAVLWGVRQRPVAPSGPGPERHSNSGSFVAVEDQKRLTFTHSHGGCGRKAFVEQAASGCAFLDYDGDGWQDILLLRGAQLPGCPDSRAPGSSLTLFRNEGGQRFVDVTLRAGLSERAYALGCCAGDYDNDGDIDLYIACWGSNRLFRNQGSGRFQECGRQTGVANSGMSTGCAWLDYNRDGRLDLYVCRYVRWDPRHDLWCGRPGRKAYCPPAHYPGEKNILYRGNSDGTFTDVTTESGVGGSGGRSLGVATADVDDDGWTDLVVANDGTPNYLFRNEGNGRFAEISIQAGVAVPESGTPKGGMGIDFADLDGSGLPSIVIGNLHYESLTLFRPTRATRFEDAAFRLGLGEASASFLTWGAFFFDFDLDGLQDIFAANGHIQEDIAESAPDVSYRQRPLLFRNTGSTGFQEVGAAWGLERPLTARGAAWGDFDNDGRPDILVNNHAGPASLLWNQAPFPPGGWLKLRLVGTRSNRSAIGAKVTLESGGQRQINWVRSGSSYCSQSDLRLNFGLGSAPRVDRVHIQWPSGGQQEIRDAAPGKILTVVER